MTRDEFLEEVTGFGSFIDFCCENNYEEFIEGIYYEDSVGSELEYALKDCIDDYLRYNSWRDVYNALSYTEGQMDYGEWFVEEGQFEYRCIDDEFDEYLGELLHQLDRDDFFDSDEEEFDEEEDGEHHTSGNYYEKLNSLQSQAMDVLSLFESCG